MDGPKLVKPSKINTPFGRFEYIVYFRDLQKWVGYTWASIIWVQFVDLKNEMDNWKKEFIFVMSYVLIHQENTPFSRDNSTRDAEKFKIKCKIF